MILQLFITGISMGMVYALMAMGLILIVKAVNVMNFAHGQIFMVGGYLGYFFSNQLGMNSLVSFILTILALMVFGVIYMFTVYWPLRNASWPVTVTISTLGASIALTEAVRLIWGPFALKVAPIVDGSLPLFGSKLQYQYVFLIVVGVVCIVFVYNLFEKFRVGRVMSAATQDSYAAELMGIPIVLTVTATYMISLALSGIGGWLSAPLFLVSQTLGNFALKAFAGIVVGGFGSVKGAVIGSIMIGLIEAYSIIITTTYRDAIVFLVLILVLLFRPQGIYGEEIEEKA
ncbi:MAG TPA: branched-chain amino acid ABC transporter permease [Clostridiaceae bacterium]|nr:branched-chain amino acid ABC transporter permease [Clostridiaceae bacterium]